MQKIDTFDSKIDDIAKNIESKSDKTDIADIYKIIPTLADSTRLEKL